MRNEGDGREGMELELTIGIWLYKTINFLAIGTDRSCMEKDFLKNTQCIAHKKTHCIAHYMQNFSTRVIAA